MSEQITKDPAADRYIVTDDGEEIGFMSYVERDDAIVIDHTVVRPEFQGEGVAGRLVGAALGDLRDASTKRVVPQCPSVAVYIKRHPEYADLTTR
ncbi:hypothetical protein HNR16_002936 [Pseudoclavibacter chungangensis]|nr:GNAT family N-acetyltransferase [Pseudoclavibacter chungangensis]NYJ68148.1 hypothetical protein [Pseudoclavibacter chungangensis]